METAAIQGSSSGSQREKPDSSLFQENCTGVRKCAIIGEHKSTHNLLLSFDSTTSLSTTTTRQAKKQVGRALLEKWPGESCVPSDGANSWVHGDERADRRYGVYYRMIVKHPFFALWETIMFEWRLHVAAVGQIWKVQTICVRDLLHWREERVDEKRDAVIGCGLINVSAGTKSQ
jgi:hypothetical protein